MPGLYKCTRTKTLAIKRRVYDAETQQNSPICIGEFSVTVLFLYNLNNGSGLCTRYLYHIYSGRCLRKIKCLFC